MDDYADDGYVVNQYTVDASQYVNAWYACENYICDESGSSGNNGSSG